MKLPKSNIVFCCCPNSYNISNELVRKIDFFYRKYSTEKRPFFYGKWVVSVALAPRPTMFSIKGNSSNSLEFFLFSDSILHTRCVGTWSGSLYFIMRNFVFCSFSTKFTFPRGVFFIPYRWPLRLFNWQASFLVLIYDKLCASILHWLVIFEK